MKIVVLDGYGMNPGDLCWDGLEKLGELTVYDHATGGSRRAHRWRAHRLYQQSGARSEDD